MPSIKMAKCAILWNSMKNKFINIFLLIIINGYNLTNEYDK